MKTAEDVKTHLEKCMDSMLARPKMWADTPLSLESQFLFSLHLCLFIDEAQEDDGRFMTRWCNWAYHEMNAEKTAMTIAGFLQKENKIDEDWKLLTNLLEKFRKDKAWVWSAEKFIKQNKQLFSIE